MRQLIVKFRPGSHQGSFGQLSVKKGLLSVITTRFLMRSVFLKFLKFWKFWGSFKDTEVYGGAGRFWEKKQDTDSGAVNASHLQLNCWCFPFYYLPFSFLPCAGIIPNAKISSFSLYTGWDLIKRDPWEFCLIDSVVIIRTYLIIFMNNVIITSLNNIYEKKFWKAFHIYAQANEECTSHAESVIWL